MITRNFNLYLNAGHSVPLVINVNQYDSGEQWVFTLYNSDGTQYTPSTGAIVGIKSDGLGIINSGSVVDGKVVINETEQMTAAVGKAVFELLIDSQTHGTANFVVLVEEKPGNNADLSESDLSLLQEAIDATSPLPTGGSVGQVLTKTASGSTWSDAGTPTQEQVADAVSDWAGEHITVTTGVVIDTSLSVAGAAADAKKTGDEITDLKSAIQQNDADISAEETRAKAEEERLEALFTAPTQEAVDSWLDEHPEATTTVQDGSLTEAKFTDELKLKTVKDYVTPEMFGAVGYTESQPSSPVDSSSAFQDMLDSAEYGMQILIPAKTYFVKNLEIPNRTVITGTGVNSVLKLHQSANANDCIFHESDSSYGYSTIKDLVLDGNKNNISVVCYGLTNAKGSGGYAKYHGLISNVIFINFTGNGLYYPDNAMEYTIENCQFTNNDNDGALFGNLMDSRIADCAFSTNGRYGLYAKGSTLKMVNSKCFMNGSYNSGAGLRLEGIHHSVSNVEIQENYNDGAHFINVLGADIDINANNNNHRDNVNGAQVRVESCKNNIFNIILSGGYMTGNAEPIVEKNGIVEVGAGNTNNRYIVIENTKQYRDAGLSDVMNLISSEYEQLSNLYMLNNDNWFNDKAKSADFNSNSVSFGYATGGSATVIDDGDAIKCTGTSPSASANGIVMRVQINDIFTAEELQKIKAGDILYCDGYMKNADGYNAYWFVQEVVDGSYTNLTAVSQPKTKANNYDKNSAIYTFPIGYSDASNTFDLRIGVNFQTTSAVEAGLTLETYIKKCKFKIQHK